MYNLYIFVKGRLQDCVSFCWVGTTSTCENCAASIGKAGDDDGRSNERPSEAPDAVGSDRRPAPAVDSRRDLSGRLAASAGRAGRWVRREPHFRARSAV